MSAPARSILLASRSAARAAMLKAAGASFEYVDAELDEAAVKRTLTGQGVGPEALAGELAAGKALSVTSAAADRLVLGADQTLELDGKLLDKPSTPEAARRQLLGLRGRSHRLHAAAAVSRGGEIVWRGADTATLWVRDFSDAFLQDYLAREGDAILGCIGAYRLEGMGAQLFDRVEGDYFTVLGLPLLQVLAYLRRVGILL